VLRLLGILIPVLAAIAAAMVTWPQFFRLERTFPFAQIVSLRGAMTVLFAGVVLLMLLLCLARPLRGFAASLAIIALAGAAVNGGILLARGAGGGTLPEKSADAIRVMTWNTAGAATDPQLIAKTAIALQADSLGVQVIAVGEPTYGPTATHVADIDAAVAALDELGSGDAVLVKDNHVVAAGGVLPALAAVRERFPDLPCEVEVDSLEQLDQMLDAGVDLVLLDNFPVWQTQIAVQRRDKVSPATRLESSGGLTFDAAADYARCGVEFLAVGGLTHSVAVLDLGLDM